MKRTILSLFLLSTLWLGADATVRAYGIRAFDGDNPTSGPTFVSWVADQTPKLKELVQYANGYYFRAGAGNDETYYLINSGYDGGDGIVPYSFYRLDIPTQQLTKVADYETFTDPEASLIITDLTYDPTEGQLYLWAFDLSAGKVQGDDDLEAPYGLYSMDPATGHTTLVGTQEEAQLAACAVSPQGIMYGIDLQGILWEIDKSTGTLSRQVGNAPVSPYGLQSMSFNMETGDLYWSGFEATDAQTGHGFMAKFTFDGDNASYQKVGDFPGMTEILGLYIDPDAPDVNAPEATYTTTVTPGKNGELTATLTWTVPDETIAGDPLTSPLTATIYRDGTLIATLDGQRPGKQDKYTDAVPTSGMYRYKITFANQHGEGDPMYFAERWIGEDTPGAVAKLEAFKSRDGIVVSWDKPEQGSHGGWYDTATISYTVTRKHDGKTIADGIGETTVRDNDISNLASYSYIVTPSTPLGAGTSSATEGIIIGAAAIPFVSDFSDAESASLWTVTDGDNDGCTWTPDNYPATGEHFMKYFPDTLDGQQPADDWLTSPLLQLEKNKVYRLRWTGRLYGMMFPYNMDVTCGQDVIYQVRNAVSELHDVWTDQTRIDVTEGGNYSIGFHAITLMPCQISQVEVVEWKAQDAMATALAGPDIAATDNTAVFTATIENNGYEDMSECNVALVDEQGNELATAQCPAMAVAKTANIELTWTPTIAGTFNIRAVVALPGDQETANDSTPWMTVSVTDGGEWLEVNKTQGYSASMPFAMKSLESKSMTIYAQDEVGSLPCRIMGLKYHYMMPVKRDLPEFDVTIRLANTDQETLSEGEEIQGMQLVFDGKMCIDKDASEVTFTFDTPFDYDGQALAIETVQKHEGDLTAVPWWIASYSADRPVSGWYDDGEGATATHDVPYVSLYATHPSGLPQNQVSNDELEFYNLQGQRITAPTHGIYILVTNGKASKIKM